MFLSILFTKSFLEKCIIVSSFLYVPECGAMNPLDGDWKIDHVMNNTEYRNFTSKDYKELEMYHYMFNLRIWLLVWASIVCIIFAFVFAQLISYRRKCFSNRHLMSTVAFHVPLPTSDASSRLDFYGHPNFNYGFEQSCENIPHWIESVPPNLCKDVQPNTLACGCTSCHQHDADPLYFEAASSTSSVCTRMNASECAVTNV